jgi:hypothetical protein
MTDNKHSLANSLARSGGLPNYFSRTSGPDWQQVLNLGFLEKLIQGGRNRLGDEGINDLKYLLLAMAESQSKYFPPSIVRDFRQHIGLENGEDPQEASELESDDGERDLDRDDSSNDSELEGLSYQDASSNELETPVVYSLDTDRSQIPTLGQQGNQHFLWLEKRIQAFLANADGTSTALDNLDRVCDFLRASDLEKQLARFFYASFHGWDKIIRRIIPKTEVDVIDISEKQGLFQILQDIFGQEHHDLIKKFLECKGPVASTLLYQGDSPKEKPFFKDPLDDFLSGEGSLTEEDICTRIIGDPVESDLTASDFHHLPDEVLAIPDKIESGAQNNALLLYGPSGTGKSSFVTTLGCTVYRLDDKLSHSGEDANEDQDQILIMPKTLNESVAEIIEKIRVFLTIKGNDPKAVLLVDEMVFPDDSADLASLRDSFQRLLESEIPSHACTIVFTTNNDDRILESARRRMDCFKIPVPHPRHQASMVVGIAEKLGISLSRDDANQITSTHTASVALWEKALKGTDKTITDPVLLVKSIRQQLEAAAKSTYGTIDDVIRPPFHNLYDPQYTNSTVRCMGVSRPKPFSEKDWLDYIRVCENQGKGSSLLLVGVTGAGHEWAPHFLADALAWSVHALGDEGDIESPRTLCTTRDFDAFRRTTRSILQGESRQHLIGVLDVPLLIEQERERLVNESQHPVVFFDCLTEKQVLRFLKKELGLPVYMKIHKENRSSQPTQLPYINLGNRRRIKLPNLDGIAPEDLRAVQASQGNPLAASPLGYLSALAKKRGMDPQVLNQRMAEILSRNEAEKTL